MFKLETDKVIFALGGVILGFGILEILERVGARWFDSYNAYAAAPAPCAAACTPFKSSPQTYDYCCKQHAANAGIV